MIRTRSRAAFLSLLLAGTIAASAANGASKAPASGTLVVLNKAEATASLIDLASGKVVATLPTGIGPHEAAVSPDGRLAVVSNYGGPTPGSTLTVIDLGAAKVDATIDLGEPARPHGLAWLPDGKRVAVTAEELKALLVVDVVERRIVARIGTDQNISHMVQVTPDGRRAFVANIGSGSVTAVDLETGRTLKSIPTGPGAEGLALTPDGRSLWVTNREADTVSVVDTTSLEVLASVKSAAFPIRAAATHDGRSVLVSNAKSGDLAVFDAKSRKERRRVAMKLDSVDTEGRLFGGRFGTSPVPIGILLHPDGKRAYVANANADAIAIVDLESWKIIGTLEAGKEPDGMAFSPRVVSIPASAGAPQ
jgi:YVTN family beta-propeller protein